MAGFLPLTHAGIAGKEAFGLECGSQFGIVQKQGAGNAEPDGFSLASCAAALNIDAHVKLLSVLGDLKRFVDDHAVFIDREIGFHVAMIYRDLARAGLDADAGSGALAPAGSEEFASFFVDSHLNSKLGVRVFEQRAGVRYRRIP